MQQTRLGAHCGGRQTVKHGSRIATPPNGTARLQHTGLLREGRRTEPGATGQFTRREFAIQQRAHHTQARGVSQCAQELRRTLCRYCKGRSVI
jgi:hypothetical protein